MTTTEESQQDDYDSPWKEAIEIMLAEFMAFYFPDAWQAIDWQQPHRFLDQELQKILPESGTGRRVVDKLVEVALVQGGDQWIHLHIEIQSSRESDFAERMMIYHYRIFDRFRRPVASLAVLDCLVGLAALASLAGHADRLAHADRLSHALSSNASSGSCTCD